MANSSFIGKAKNKIIKEFIKNKAIIDAIDYKELKKPQDLIGKRIFDYHQNLNTINDVMTFLTVQIHLPQSYNFESKILIQPQVEIWIISHVSHMIVDNIPKVAENRNDYISKLIDILLNGRSDFGIGKLALISNIEGSYQADYVYRKLVFQGLDFNDSLCDIED